MDPGEDAGRIRVAADMRDEIETNKLRARLYLFSFAVALAALAALLCSLVLAAGSPGRALRQLRRPPTEVWFSIPIAAVLLLMAMTSHREVGPAVATITVAGIIFAWVSGATLRLVPRSRWRLVLHLSTVSLGIAATAYIAVHRGHLIDQIFETVRFGPDV